MQCLDPISLTNLLWGNQVAVLDNARTLFYPQIPWSLLKSPHSKLLLSLLLTLGLTKKVRGAIVYPTFKIAQKSMFSLQGMKMIRAQREGRLFDAIIFRDDVMWSTIDERIRYGSLGAVAPVLGTGFSWSSLDCKYRSTRHRRVP